MAQDIPESMATEKRFSYDEPGPLRIRLFTIDVDRDDGPVSGVLLHSIRLDMVKSHQGFWALLKPRIYVSGTTAFRVGSDHGFDAVSWCWGPPERNKSIWLRGVSPKISMAGNVGTRREKHRDGSLEVRPTLYDLLLQLRARKFKRYLWIDAICIDQEDLRDKYRMIPPMADIYGNVNKVWIWLGKASPSGMSALQRLPQITKRLFSCRRHKRDSRKDVP